MFLISAESGIVELIAYAAHRLDNVSALPELLPQCSHMDIDCARFAAEIIASDIREQLFPC